MSILPLSNEAFAPEILTEKDHQKACMMGQLHFEIRLIVVVPPLIDPKLTERCTEAMVSKLEFPTSA